jgi:hypothetical protein
MGGSLFILGSVEGFADFYFVPLNPGIKRTIWRIRGSRTLGVRRLKRKESKES